MRTEQQAVSPIVYDYPIIDGFLYKTRLRCNLTFLSMAIQEYEALRRSRAYRTRYLTIPEDPQNFLIPARDTYEYQSYCRPGSAFWGFIFVATAGQFSVQVTDACTDQPLFSETLAATVSGQQQLLSKLLVVAKPGLLNVEISSLVANDARGVQFILCGGEPVYDLEEISHGK